MDLCSSVDAWSLILGCVLCHNVSINWSLSEMKIPLYARPINTTSVGASSNSDSSDDSAMLEAVHDPRKSPKKSALSLSNRTKELSFRVVFNNTLNIHEFNDQKLVEHFTEPVQDAIPVIAVNEKATVDSMVTHHDHQLRILRESQYRIKVVGLSFAAMILVVLLALVGWSLWYYQMTTL